MESKNNLELGILGDQIDVEQLQKVLKQNQRFRQMMVRYRCGIMEVETKFRVLNEEFSLLNDRNPIQSIKTRLKSPASLLGKLQRKGLPVTFQSMSENILDIAGVRVICSFEDDVYYLCRCIEQQDDIDVISKKDYIAHPKDNGYRSLHLTVKIPIFLAEEVVHVPVEIQLRTIAMDFWASLEHTIRYKKDLEENEAVSQELLNCANSSALWDQKMANLMHLLHDKERLDPFEDWEE